MIKPSRAGSLPKCTTELKTATLGCPSAEIVPIRLAGLIPVIALMSFNRATLDKALMSCLERIIRRSLRC
ncbi:hypothetical protein [Altibacter sp.]|uniref:hypothetical protein n=1 Tax=Altibacter sp. TaxID=2024823 RepID=UPI0025BD0224|nr:hypothetical protein [Altibacter sp.]